MATTRARATHPGGRPWLPRLLWTLVGLSLFAGLVVIIDRTPLPLFSLGGCGLSFSDDFDSAALNPRRWNVQYASGRNELQYYAPVVFTLAGGIVRIRARAQPQHGRSYTSGILTTQGRFTQQYGFFEIRAQVPAGQGLWPAFWLLHASPNAWNEIDIFEILGHQTDTVYLSQHWPDEAQQLASASQSYAGPDFSAGFHTFAVDWTPDRLVWYVDGVARADSSEHVPAEPMFLLVNLAVGGQWPGNPDASTHFPADLAIDYIHVYAPGCRPPGLATPTPLP